MFSFKKNALFKYFSTNSRNQVNKFRKEIDDNYRLKDFTKNHDSKEWLKGKIQERKDGLPKEKFSSLLSKKNITKKSLRPYFKPDKRQLNKYLRGQTMNVLQKTEDVELLRLSETLFHKDHTAQVLENYRKIRENKIFNRKLHEIKEKKLSLKLESRKISNLIPDYEIKFGGYEKFNNTAGFHEKQYSLESFSPITNFKYAFNLETANPMYEERNISNQLTKFEEYTNNKKLLENKRIDSLLRNNTRNDELNRFLSNDNDDVKLIEEKSLTEVKQNEITMTKPFEEHVELTNKLNTYELEVYNEFKKLDLYDKYNKGIIEFKDLSVEENLNYVKFNLKNTNELFKMYTEVRELSPIITCALVQKISLGYKEEKDKVVLFQKKDYKDMLIKIKKNLKTIDNKNLIDTFWSIGRIHRTNRTFYPLFFQHLLDEFITEFKSRMEFLNIIEISFLCQAISYYRINSKNDDLKVLEDEYNLSQKIMDNILSKEISYLNPFHMAKILIFYYQRNDTRLELLLSHMYKPLRAFLEDKEAINIDIMNMNDLIKIIQVYSWSLMKKETKEYIEILKIFSNIILPNRKKYEIKHAAMIIKYYSNARLFLHELTKIMQLQIDDELIAKKEFSIKDALNYCFGISKYYTKDIFPNFNMDINCIIYPNLFEKSNSYKFITIKKIHRLIFERQDMFNVSSLSLILYSASLMGYPDIDFYLPVYHNIIAADGNIPLVVEDIGYFMQTLSLLNYNENKFIDYFLNKLQKSYKLANNVFSISQVLSAVVNLNAKKNIRGLKDWEKLMDEIIEYGTANIGDNVSAAVSFLWFFTYMDKVDNNFFDYCYELINLKKDKLTKYDKVIFNQIVIYNYMIHNYINSCLSDETLNEMGITSLDFDKERKKVQNKISKGKYEDDSIHDRIKNVFIENESKLKKLGLGFEENVNLYNSYTVPFIFPKNKKCIFIYDHSEKLKSKSLNGYNSMIQQIVHHSGYKIITLSDETDIIAKIIN